MRHTSTAAMADYAADEIRQFLPAATVRIQHMGKCSVAWAEQGGLVLGIAAHLESEVFGIEPVYLVVDAAMGIQDAGDPLDGFRTAAYRYPDQAAVRLKGRFLELPTDKFHDEVRSRGDGFGHRASLTGGELPAFIKSPDGAAILARAAAVLEHRSRA